MKALLLIDEQAAFEILGDDAGWYGDNGGDPDGNAWLPMTSNEITDKLMQTVAGAGYGRIVEVEEADDEQIAELLGVTLPPKDSDLWEDALEDLKCKANRYLQWAHYGAYGVMDSRWVYVSLDNLEMGIIQGLFNMVYLETADKKRIIVHEMSNSTRPYRIVTVNAGLSFNAEELAHEVFNIYPDSLEHDPEFMVDTEAEKAKFHQLLTQYAGPDYHMQAWKPWKAQ